MMSINMSFIKCWNNKARECNAYCPAFRDLDLPKERLEELKKQGYTSPAGYDKDGVKLDALAYPMPKCRFLQNMDGIENALENTFERIHSIDNILQKWAKERGLYD